MMKEILFGPFYRGRKKGSILMESITTPATTNNEYFSSMTICQTLGILILLIPHLFIQQIWTEWQVFKVVQSVNTGKEKRI
jgi:hypothetical protein